MAVSPPPTTMTSLPRKKKPSQVAQALTPRPWSIFSDSRPSHSALAPVAMTIAWASCKLPLASHTLKGRFEKSTLVIRSEINWVPKRSAWARNSCMSSGPVTDLAKPG
ncbi:hypothetical protein D3C72_932730 [compost metagenome]